MIIEDFKTTLLSKSVGRIALPANADLYERIYTALKRVATDTIPLRLSTIVAEDGLVTFPVFRKPDKTLYVRFPDKPIIDEDEIDIDEALIDAVALYVMAGLERGNAKTHMGLYYREIDINNDRLTETELADADNDCAERFMVFP